MKVLNIFTDGSYIHNRGNGKYKSEAIAGYAVHFPENDFDDVYDKFVFGNKTNQRAELYAIYVALQIIFKHADNYDRIIIYTDSEYSIKSLTIWIKQWLKNGWKTTTNKNVDNRDIIEPIYDMLVTIGNKLIFKHVRSHTGKDNYESKHNEIVDKLAKKGAQKNLKKTDRITICDFLEEGSDSD